MTQNELNIIWNEFNNALLFFIKKRVKSDEDAKDLLQEVFIKISQKDYSFSSSSQLTSFIYKVTRNTIIDHWRSQGKNSGRVISLDFDPGDNITEEVKTEFSTVVDCIHKMKSVIPEKYSVVFDLYEDQKLSHKQIAEKLNISVSGSKTRLQRAREKIKALLISCCKIETDKYGNILKSCSEEEEQCNNCDDP